MDTLKYYAIKIDGAFLTTSSYHGTCRVIILYDKKEIAQKEIKMHYSTHKTAKVVTVKTY